MPALSASAVGLAVPSLAVPASIRRPTPSAGCSGTQVVWLCSLDGSRAPAERCCLHCRDPCVTFIHQPLPAHPPTYTPIPLPLTHPPLHPSTALQIIFMSSIAAQKGFGAQVPYCVSKVGAHGWGGHLGWDAVSGWM